MLLIMLILLEGKVHKIEVGWEFELMTVASQRRQRETISLIFFKI